MAELKMLAIDLGASSGRGIIGKFDGKKFTLEENHRFPSEPVTIAGSFKLIPFLVAILTVEVPRSIPISCT